MSEEITIESIDAKKAISMKVTTSFADLADEVKKRFNEANAKLLVSGGTQKGERFLILHHKEGKLNPEKIEAEICIPVAGLSKAPIDWDLASVPAVKKAACIIHSGAYNKNTGPSYDKLYAWLNAKGLVPAGPFREVYMHEPFLVKEEFLETKILCPLPDDAAV